MRGCDEPESAVAPFATLTANDHVFRFGSRPCENGSALPGGPSVAAGSGWTQLFEHIFANPGLESSLTQRRVALSDLGPAKSICTSPYYAARAASSGLTPTMFSTRVML